MGDRVSAREAIALVCDDFTEQEPPEGPGAPDGPIAWEGYDAARARAAARTGSKESVVYGEATLGGRGCVLISFEFGFLGGSLSERAGDRLEAAYGLARARRWPLISLIATGGSRMQEGMIALSQLQRVARASVLLRDAGVPHIAVLRDPTTGGGWATLGAGADVILAVPGAQVGFAGSRVRPPDADPTAYTAEGQLASGQIDAMVRGEELREVLSFWATALGERAARTRGGGAGDAEPEAASTARATPGPAGPESATASADPARVEPAPPPRALTSTALPRTGWDAVQQARVTTRPRAEAYLDQYFTHRRDLSGDRCGGTDPGLLCGVGLHDGRAIAYVAQCGTPTRPAGYRTAARVVRLAGRVGIPVLTLIDTPGAANDAEAERAGAGAAIAELFSAVAAARTPLTSLLIGEGGSGGALALAAPGNTWATADSYFSVIAPELAAAILKRGPEQVPRTADQLRLRPQDLVELGVVRGIVAPDH
ncbi:acetyl-CoA carboxylase [Streptomyces lunaelactis]|uniref:carboxyl transferase domain-containing protein n=13 Tax=Streptomyces lunaelactis TaxID=1535768 RepID=UPI001584BE23|nr:carboxyl transferase domain-containing protein [Streptomyces lunaelactis]NUK37430.1 acetyl-CoA carboxylase [Streptomyces lunaelactis]NUK60505.1 acetyl-CoA carboxylase [Streptomyces lunaelactis]NUK70618.1 acetyl-CoA carboxylase [Streptomyces lunaelactis]NUK79404.1 acetyl-CoA carboxylase [Streptomyces lunaelactis]NUK95772.1 acetyl-CoA carboxylase [Streptomyces lunaelactis]